jgi:hypothetical protein
VVLYHDRIFGKLFYEEFPNLCFLEVSGPNHNLIAFFTAGFRASRALIQAMY